MFKNLKTKINNLDKDTVAMSAAMLSVPVLAVATVVTTIQMIKD